MACTGCAERRAKMVAFAKSVRQKFRRGPAIKPPSAVNVDGVKIIDIRRKED